MSATTLTAVEVLDGVDELYEESPEAWTRCQIGWKGKNAGRTMCCLIGAVSYSAGLIQVNPSDYDYDGLLYPDETAAEGYPNLEAARTATMAMAEVITELGYAEPNSEMSLSFAISKVTHFNDRVAGLRATMPEVIEAIKQVTSLAKARLQAA